MDFETASRILAGLRAPDPVEAEAASMVGGYRLVARVGGGGGGEVYRAVRDGSDRPVALKLLHRPRDSVAAARAWRELDVLASLHIAALPRVLDYGLHEGRLYIVTEFVDGAPLEALALPASAAGGNETGRRRRHATSDALLRPRVELLAKASDVVAQLHEHGVIHRDLKPGNILVDPHGEPVIIDLGLAAVDGEEARTLTEGGVPIGSPAFMAPEQARGERSRISTRTDVYGLGATAVFVLTGRTPHDIGPDVTLHEALRRVAFDEPRDPRGLDASLPRGLAAVLAKACAREPGRRYAGAGEFAADLRRWLNRQPVEAVAPGVWVRMGRWIGGHPVGATAAACAAIVVLSVLMSGGIIYTLLQRPYTLRLDAVTSSRVDLLSFGGRPIATWEDPTQGAVVSHGLIWDHGRGHSRPLVWIAWDGLAETNLRGSLCVYDPARPHEHLWSKGGIGRDLVLPPDPPDAYDNSFRLQHKGVMLADIFPEPEGEPPADELVAIHIHGHYSPTAVRVYRARDGAVLYEAWHDGVLDKAHWLSGPGRLILCGGNADDHWKNLASAAGEDVTWPFIVFALEPEMGLHAGFVRTPHWAGRMAPVWYKYLHPYPNADAVHLAPQALAAPRSDVDPAWHFSVHVETRGDPPAGLTMVFDSDAVEDLRLRSVADNWINRVEFAPEAVCLGDPPE